MSTNEAPASISQRLLWMIQHYRSRFGALSCPLLCRLRGPLDRMRLQAALEALELRHASLRTTFAGRGARLRQCVHPPRSTPLPMTDLAGHTDPDAALASALAAELATPVDTSLWPTRATLWRLHPGEHVLCLNIHHLVTDAYSTGILLRDLATLYLRPDSAAVSPQAWSYTRFARWQRDLLTGAELDRQRAYWRRQLDGARPPQLGAAGNPRPGGATSAARDLSPTAVRAARDLSRQHQTTLFTTMLASFFGHIHQVTGQTDIAVASMFANRFRPELRETVGLLANMLLLRVVLEPGLPFTELLRRTHHAVMGAVAYQDLPFQMLPTDLLAPDAGRPDDVVFQMMADFPHQLTAGDLELVLLLPDQLGSRFPFELTVVATGESSARAVLSRADDRLDDTGAAAFLSGYADLLAAAAANPAEQLSRLARRPAASSRRAVPAPSRVQLGK